MDETGNSDVAVAEPGPDSADSFGANVAVVSPARHVGVVPSPRSGAASVVSASGGVSGSGPGEWPVVRSGSLACGAGIGQRPSGRWEWRGGGGGAAGAPPPP